MKKKALENLWWKRGIVPPNPKGSVENLWYYKDKEKTKLCKKKMTGK